MLLRTSSTSVAASSDFRVSFCGIQAQILFRQFGSIAFNELFHCGTNILRSLKLFFSAFFILSIQASNTDVVGLS